MSLTYTDDRTALRDDGLRPYAEMRPAGPAEEPFVPVYARTRSRRARRSGLQPWLILGAAAAVLLGGTAAIMLLGGERESAALSESAPLAPAAILEPASPLAAAPEPVEAVPVPRVAAAPTARVRPAPAAASATSEAPATPAESDLGEAVTATLNTAPPAPAATPAPVIIVEPL